MEEHMERFAEIINKYARHSITKEGYEAEMEKLAAEIGSEALAQLSNDYENEICFRYEQAEEARYYGDRR